MKKEQIEKDDGRYLIFYTFEDEKATDSEAQPTETKENDERTGN